MTHRGGRCHPVEAMGADGVLNEKAACDAIASRCPER